MWEIRIEKQMNQEQKQINEKLIDTNIIRESAEINNR